MNKQSYPKIGAHVSVAGGIDKAPQRAADEGCEAFQCFTRPPQGGPAPKLSEELILSFQSEMKRNDIERFYIHAPYYINLASLKPAIRHSSIRVLREELERGTLLDAQAIMAHVGSHTDQTLEEGLKKVIDGISEILDGYEGTTKFLIEISAGSGNVIADRFEEIAAIIDGIGKPKGFGGICFDTCHAFASGYDYTSPEKAEETLEEFDSIIGLNYLKLTHVNDSKTPLGGKKDRHEHIGKGHVGENGLKSLLQTKAFMGIDWLLETESDDRPNDITILKKIRKSA